MNAAQLRALSSQDLCNLCTDCQLDPDLEQGDLEGSLPRSGAGRRERMVARLLEWQRREHQRQGIKDDGTASLLEDGAGEPATPCRRRRLRKEPPGHPCRECGRMPLMGICACGLMRLDPFCPAMEVLAFERLAPENRSQPCLGSARFTLRYLPPKEDEGIELRMVSRMAPERHCWPACAAVLAGDEKVAHIERQMPNQPPRRDAPLVLQHLLLGSAKASKTAGKLFVTLEVGADTSPSLAEDWFVAVVRTGRARGVPDLMAEVLGNACIPEATTKRLLDSLWEREKQLISAQDESAVECSTPWTVPLTCPIAWQRMTHPVRGRECSHLQCFDLEAYLTTTLNTVFHRRWFCPLCRCALFPKDLTLCELTRRLLRCAAPDQAVEVLDGLACDGEVTPLRRRNLESPSECKVTAPRSPELALRPDAAPLSGAAEAKLTCTEERLREDDVSVVSEGPPRKRPMVAFACNLKSADPGRVLTLQLSV